MSTDKTPNRRRVRYSDGGTFEVEVRNAGEYLLTSTFLHFYVICITIYAMTLWPQNNLSLDALSSIVVWCSVLFSAFIVLLIGVWLNLLLVDKGKLTYIHTPLILIPVVAVSTFLGGNISIMLGSTFGNSFMVFFQATLSNVILVVCFDIFHGRYVAPQHPAFIPPNAQTATASQIGLTPQPEPQAAQSGSANDTESTLVKKAAFEHILTSTPEQLSASDKQPDADRQRASKLPKIEFGKDSFVATDILWIQSESHYLRLQMHEKSYMVRAKLSAAVKGLSDELGIQVNRSVWVAFSAMETCEEDAAGYLELRLTDKSTHRVSKARQLVVKAKYDEAQKAKNKDLV